MMSALRRRIKRGLPIQLTILAFPFKVPNPAKVGARSLPDFAELAAIRHLQAFRDAVGVVYPPGLEFHILHDGSLIADVFEIPLQEVRRYELYFAELITMARASNFIRCHDFTMLQQRCAFDPRASVEHLRLAAERWWHGRRGTLEWRVSFQKTLGMINLREFSAAFAAHLMNHASLGHLPADCELDRRVHEAMVQYHVKDAIIHQFDPRPACFPDAIHATTQDRHGRLSIWMVRRGQSLLPWHGLGCLDDRGRAQVRRAADIFNRPNYRPISVAGEKTPFLHLKSTTSLAIGRMAVQSS
jgi:Pyoverdine/dityrosine biosynthesis protein